MTYYDDEPERIPYTLLRETVVRIRKPRRLSCGSDAKVGDVSFQTVGLSDGEFFMDERCERCEADMRGYEFSGPRHGNLNQPLGMPR